MRDFLRSRSFLAICTLALLALMATQLFEVRNADPRPVGTPADLASLRERPVNLLFILIDTLRADRLSAYGYERETSPTLDYMAATGVRFASHLSQSTWTKCSMASLWTGLNPIRTGVLRSEHAAPVEATMPAEVLREAGFRTAGIWRNGWVAPNFGFGQGFEVYKRPRPNRPSAQIRAENPHVTLEGTDDDVVDAAVEFLRVHGDERWFLYVHLMDVHQYLYDTETALFGTAYSDVYDNSIRHEDEVVGRLLTHLAQKELLQDTLVVITSDHGEAFGERGFEGHARHVYRETTHVPLVLGLPFLIEGGLVVDRPTRNVDVWPTLLDLLGLPALPGVDGRSLMPSIAAAANGANGTNGAGGSDEEQATGYAHLERGWGRRDAPTTPAVAVVQDGFRFVVERTPERDIEELFHGEQDPLEVHNVIEAHPEVAARLRERAEAYFESEPPPWGVEAPSVELDQMELNQLRALGYAVP